jgi:type I restriction enzyme M protein
MAVITTVCASALEFGNRIDAELYKPSLRTSFKMLFRTGVALERLRRVCTIRSGTTPPDRVDGLKSGAILFKTTDIRNGIISPSGDYYRISNEIHKRMEKTALHDRDVLLNIVGATLEVIGRSALIVGLKNGANITQAMVLLRTRNADILPGYLFAYLNTRFGQDQIARYARPTGQYNLNLHEVGHLLIPLLPVNQQQAVETLIISAAGLQVESAKHREQAQQLIETALSLNSLAFRKPVGYTASLSELEASRRFDSEHYFPSFRAFRNGLPREIALSPLSHHISFCKRGMQPSYSRAGLAVINSKHVQPNKVVLDGNRQARPNKDANLQIRSGDTLLNGTGRGTIGRAAPYLDENPAVADNHVTILRSKNLDPAYLSLYLNSQAGQMQVETHQRGSSGQLELYPLDIRKFLVWAAPDDFQREVRRLHDTAAEAERQSHMLLEQAKLQVEKHIEEAVQP